MNRTNILNRSLSLLLWLLAVVGARAQSLEYWFDKKVNPKPLSLSGGRVSTDIDVKNLKTGIHTLHLRAKSGSNYSPVSSSLFFKFPARGTSEIEYWFDGDVDNLASMPIDDETEALQLVDLDLTDSKKFPIGLHQLSMRIATASGIYSPVYNALVMRMPAGTGNSVIEYWFDGDNTKFGTIPVNVESGALQILNLDMTNFGDFPYGLHKLNMRVAAYGNQYSPVYSAFVMRLPTGANSHLTYWIDDNYKDGRTQIKAYSSNGLYANFDARLNLSSVSSGMHRLHFRIAKNGVDDGVVYEVPILVTRMYNQQADVKVIGESHWFDESNGALSLISNPQSIYTKSYILDPASFVTGQHAFHVQYKNSAEVWSDPNITYFYKEPATGRLRAGIMPKDPTGIEDTSQAESISCAYYNGTIYIDCESPQLGKTGVIIVCDMMGRVVAQQNVINSDGIHAAVSVDNLVSQLLIVKLNSGNIRYSQKIIKR